MSRSVQRYVNSLPDTFLDSSRLQRWRWSTVCWALLLSAVLHAILSTYLWQRWGTGSMRPALTVDPVVRHFQLVPRRKSPEPSVITNVEPQPQPQVPRPEAPISPRSINAAIRAGDSSPRPQSPTTHREGRKLDLSLPKTSEPSVLTAPSERSATVFDSKLVQALELARQRSGAFPAAAPDIQPADSFVGGQRLSFVKIGKLCFDVLEPDPLDSFGQPQWFPRSCDSLHAR